MTDRPTIPHMDTETPEENGTGVASYDTVHKYYYTQAMLIVTFIICLFGLVGNGLMLWFLFFKAKNNICTVYIANLALADTTFLVGSVIILVVYLCAHSGIYLSRGAQDALNIGGILYNIGFNTSSFVLTAISMERCILVLLPMWYQRRQLKKQYVIVCVILWMLSCLVMGLENFVCSADATYPEPGSEKCTAVYLFTSALYILVVILMVLSSLVLLIEITKTSKECHPPKLYIIIVLSVIIFLLSVVPARVLGLLLYFGVLPSNVYLLNAFFITILCTSIYCSANPFAYIFVGIWKRQCFRCSIMRALEKLFKEETESS
ncbi:mas-related G-protein coupled receptor member H-like [Ambystoma mexicanum]|uniref:mas-related G-protein coupled receptor member H-like n=1 Tax=Ambystoma mexicanum TaxID=8296 RepID=UPI0037E8980D